MRGIILNFMLGGTVTALIVGLEESGRRTWSGLAALVPNKAIGLGLALFFVLAGGYVGVVERYGVFR